uniref:Uncharacterized protein n=1 Tax=viral metagenome TaxID=1070528 RepID=A0A6C0BUS0_9ZZZZ
MSIQSVDSAPEYILNFLKDNLEQLNKIYDDGKDSLIQDGLLVCKCSQKENRIDIQFMTDEMFSEIITKESWIPYKESLPKDKKFMFIQDLDLDCVFLINL